MMYFAPHLMQVRDTSDVYDEFGRLLPDSEDAQWRSVCFCRCDNSGRSASQSLGGSKESNEYRVVCPTNYPECSVNDAVRILDAEGFVIAQGEISRIHRLTYLPYAEINIKG